MGKGSFMLQVIYQLASCFKSSVTLWQPK